MPEHVCSAACVGKCHIPTCDLSEPHWHGGFYRFGHIRDS